MIHYLKLAVAFAILGTTMPVLWIGGMIALIPSAISTMWISPAIFYYTECFACLSARENYEWSRDEEVPHCDLCNSTGRVTTFRAIITVANRARTK